MGTVTVSLETIERALVAAKAARDYAEQACAWKEVEEYHKTFATLVAIVEITSVAEKL